MVRIGASAVGLNGIEEALPTKGCPKRVAMINRKRTAMDPGIEAIQLSCDEDNTWRYPLLLRRPMLRLMREKSERRAGGGTFGARTQS